MVIIPRVTRSDASETWYVHWLPNLGSVVAHGTSCHFVHQILAINYGLFSSCQHNDSLLVLVLKFVVVAISFKMLDTVNTLDASDNLLWCYSLQSSSEC